MSDTSEDLDVSGDSGTVICPTNYRRTSPSSPSSTRIKRLKPYDQRHSSLETKDSASTTAIENSRLPSVPDRNYWTDKDCELYYRSNRNGSRSSPVSPSSPGGERTPTGSVLEPLLPLRLQTRGFWPTDRESENLCRTNGHNPRSSTSPEDSTSSTNGGWKDAYEESDEDKRIRLSLLELKRLIDDRRLPQSQLVQLLNTALFKECNQDKEKALGKLVTAREETRRLRLHMYSNLTPNPMHVPLYDLYRLPHPQLSTPATMTSIPHSFTTHPHTPRPLRLYGPGFYVENVLPSQRYYPVDK